jgi:nicotinamide-nucleotide amidase
MEHEPLSQLAESLGAELLRVGKMLVTAESCTGGWVGEVVTSIPGSSKWYERGFITYTNVAKQEMLGVAAETLAQYGAVSEETVREMVAGALAHSHAQVALAISGIAGPGGATPFKPVGTVCFGWGGQGLIETETKLFPGDRQTVRQRAVAHALEGILARLRSGQV